MTNEILVKAIAEKTGFTQKDTAVFVRGFKDVVMETLATGEPIKMPGFGNFVVVDRKARQGRNPQTGEMIAIPAKKAISFKPGKTLKGCVTD